MLPPKALVALVNALPGAEAEFNAWYAEHYRLSDVQVPGAAAAENEHPTIYEIDGEVAAVLADIAARRRDGTC